MMKKERIAIVTGGRSPFLKMSSDYAPYDADDLGAFVLRHLMLRSEVSVDEIDDAHPGCFAANS